MKKTHIFVLFGALALTGCGIHEAGVKSDLHDMVKDLKPKIAELPAPIVYEPYLYTQGDMIDPFAPSKISMKLLPHSDNTPDMDRQKEPLEAFPIESIKMVGSVKISDGFEAILNADGYMYRVRAGNYVGLNYGKVENVSETDLVLKEMYQESNGDWNVRQTYLTMQNNAGVRK